MRKLIFVLTAVALLVAGNAWADTSSKMMTRQDFKKGNLIRANALLDRDVTYTTKDGEITREFERVLLDPQTGQIKAATIMHGGILGLGGEEVLVPWSKVDFRSKDVAYKLDRKYNAAEAPRYTGRRGGVYEREEFDQDYPKWDYTKETFRESRKARVNLRSASLRGRKIKDMEAYKEGQGLIDLERLINRDIYNAKGDTVATVDAVYIDPSKGRVTMLFVEHGGILGLGGELRAVPYNALRFNWNERRFESNLVEQDFDKARMVEDKDAWVYSENWVEDMERDLEREIDAER